VADAQHLPYGDASFDAVFNFGIIHHLEDWEQGIREIARVLVKGGALYFEEIYPPLYANPLFRHLLAHPTENRFFGSDFRQTLSQAGLTLVLPYRESRLGILGVAEKD
jgi:ubiquinone/menaquinone biosynthesis C-methylase UbiE